MIQIKLERIGDDTDALCKMCSGIVDDNTVKGAGRHIVGRPPRREWCAEIVGTHPKYRFERRFLAGNVSYIESNGSGSRGVYAFYNLENGKCYEVKEPASWSRSDRYFLLVESDEAKRVTAEEVSQWLRAKIRSV